MPLRARSTDVGGTVYLVDGLLKGDFSVTGDLEASQHMLALFQRVSHVGFES